MAITLGLAHLLAMDNIGLQFGLMNSLGRIAGDSPLVSILLCALVPFLLKEASRAAQPSVHGRVVIDCFSPLFQHGDSLHIYIYTYIHITRMFRIDDVYVCAYIYAYIYIYIYAHADASVCRSMCIYACYVCTPSRA